MLSKNSKAWHKFVFQKQKMGLQHVHNIYLNDIDAKSGPIVKFGLVPLTTPVVWYPHGSAYWGKKDRIIDF